MIGIDIVDIERFRKVLKRSPWLERGLFTEEERRYCNGRSDPVRHFASTFAAKEAVVKATGVGPLPAAVRRVEIVRDHVGRPVPSIVDLPGRRVTVTLSHEGGLTIAMAIAISTAPKKSERANTGQRGSQEPRPNGRLLRYLGFCPTS